MKVTELKIGDWILYEGEIAKILGLLLDKCSIIDEEGSYIDTVRYDDLTPIHLTEEILEKNGWKKTKTDRCDGSFWDYRFKHKDRQNLFMKDGVVYNSFYMMDTIPYVHQLQHILWALGMDDNLKL